MKLLVPPQDYHEGMDHVTGDAAIVSRLQTAELLSGPFQTIQDFFTASENAKQAAEYEKDEIQKTLQLAHKRIADLLQDLGRRDKTISELEREREGQYKNLAEARKDFATKSRELSDQVTQNETLEKQKQDAEDRAEASEQDIQELARKIESLMKELEEVQDASATTSQQLSDQAEQNKTLEKQKQDAEDRAEAVEHDIRELTTKNEIQQRELFTVRNQITTKLSEVDLLRRAKASLEEKQATATKTANKATSDLTAALENVQKQAKALETNENVIEALLIEKTTLTDEKTCLMKEKTSAEGKCRILHDENDALSTMKTETEMQLESLRATEKDSYAKFEILKTESSNLEHRLRADLKRKNEELEMAKGQAAEANKAYKREQQRLGNLVKKGDDEMSAAGHQTQTAKSQIRSTIIRLFHELSQLDKDVNDIPTGQEPKDPRLISSIAAQAEEPKHLAAHPLDRLNWLSFKRLTDPATNAQDYYPPLVDIDTSIVTGSMPHDRERHPNRESLQNVSNSKLEPTDLRKHDWQLCKIDFNLSGIWAGLIKSNHSFKDLSVEGQTSTEDLGIHAREAVRESTKRVIDSRSVDNKTSTISTSEKPSQLSDVQTRSLPLADACPSEEVLEKGSSKSSTPRRKSSETSSSACNTSSERSLKRTRAESEDEAYFKERPVKYTGKAVCRPCLETGQCCSSRGQCDNCKIQDSDCWYTNCPDREACKTTRCNRLHPGQWRHSASGKWRSIDFDRPRYGSDSKRPRCE